MKRLFSIILMVVSIISMASLRALIVYVSDYDSRSILDLPAAEKDAQKVKSFLDTIPDANVTLLENPSMGDLIREFKKWVRSAKIEETLIFYYAGHGMSKDGIFYFIPKDADPEDEDTWVSFGKSSWKRRDCSRGCREILLRYLHGFQRLDLLSMAYVPPRSISHWPIRIPGMEMTPLRRRGFSW